MRAIEKFAVKQRLTNLLKEAGAVDGAATAYRAATRAMEARISEKAIARAAAKGTSAGGAAAVVKATKPSSAGKVVERAAPAAPKQTAPSKPVGDSGNVKQYLALQRSHNIRSRASRLRQVGKLDQAQKLMDDMPKTLTQTRENTSRRVEELRRITRPSGRAAPVAKPLGKVPRPQKVRVPSSR